MEETIFLRNSKNNCCFYVLFETLFCDLSEIKNSKSTIINSLKKLSTEKNISKLSSDVDILRKSIEGNKAFDQEDFFVYLKKISEIIQKEDMESFLKLYGIYVNNNNYCSKNITPESYFFPLTYDEVKLIDFKNKPKYIIFGLDQLVEKKIPLTFYFDKDEYELNSMVFHLGDHNGGHWYCYKKDNSGNWYYCNNILEKKIKMNSLNISSMPKISIYKKITKNSNPNKNQ